MSTQCLVTLMVTFGSGRLRPTESVHGGEVASATDLHPEAFAFKADMPAGRARMAYWPADNGGIHWAPIAKRRCVRKVGAKFTWLQLSGYADIVIDIATGTSQLHSAQISAARVHRHTSLAHSRQ